jgi:cysteine-rich repeat protein
MSGPQAARTSLWAGRAGNGVAAGVYRRDITRVCGDGVVVPGEECDDGNLIDGDGCDSNCRFTGCGNGIVTAGEECDDGNHIDNDGCTNACTICGNGVVSLPEQCDDGNLIDGDGCESNCTAPVCGNGIVDAGEQCDDGNLASGDGCSGSCQSELVRGGASKKTDCTHEWLTVPVPAPDSSGAPKNSLICTDDDPTCDFGAAGDAACTFHVALCFNVTEQRFACSPTDVALVQLKAPREDKPTDPFDIGNRDALEAVLTGAGGLIRGLCTQPRSNKGQLCVTNADCDSASGSGNGKCAGRLTGFVPPLTTTNTCTGFAAIKVPLRANGRARGTKTLRLVATPSNNPVTGKKRTSDTDSLTLVCKPHR